MVVAQQLDKRCTVQTDWSNLWDAACSLLPVEYQSDKYSAVHLSPNNFNEIKKKWFTHVHQHKQFCRVWRWTFSFCGTLIKNCHWLLATLLSSTSAYFSMFFTHLTCCYGAYLYAFFHWIGNWISGKGIIVSRWCLWASLFCRIELGSDWYLLSWFIFVPFVCNLKAEWKKQALHWSARTAIC